MPTNSLIRSRNSVWLLCAFVIFEAQIAALSADENSEQILKLLPRSVDMVDNTEVANYRRLVAMGDKAYPALAKELLETTDDTVAGRILSIFTESKGDKTIPRTATRQLLNERSHVFSDKEALRMMVAGVLGKIGQREDAALLHDLLKDTAVPVKIRALRALAQIGGEDSLNVIRHWKEGRQKGGAEAVETAVDSEADKAIEAIQRRSPAR